MNILDYTIWETRFSWNDAVDCMDKQTRKLFESLPDPIKLKIIKHCTRSLESGLDSGLMTDWTDIMETALSCVDLFADLIGERVLVDEPSADDSWNHSFTGSIVSVQMQEDQEDIIFEVVDADNNYFDVAASRVIFINENDEPIDEYYDVKPSLKATVTVDVEIPEWAVGRLDVDQLADLVYEKMRLGCGQIEYKNGDVNNCISGA